MTRTRPVSDASAAYQGVPGAFSEGAARRLFGPRATLVPQRTLEDVFGALARGDVGSAVVPVENTLAGAVPGAADLLARHDVHIVAEHVERIAHALVARPGTRLDEVRQVRSHPVAIAQCESFFRARPDVTPVATFDTAGAVAEIMIAERSGEAAIASARAAHLYGAWILAEEIQDRADNFTRFLRLDAGPAPDTPRTGCKTTLICRLTHTPGALAHALRPLEAYRLNVTRIESRPARDAPFEYVFHLDVGPTDDPEQLGLAMRTMRSRCQAWRLLGHYPV